MSNTPMEDVLDKCASPYNCRHAGRYRDSAIAAMKEWEQICMKERDEIIESLKCALKEISTGVDWPHSVAIKALQQLKQLNNGSRD